MWSGRSRCQEALGLRGPNCSKDGGPAGINRDTLSRTGNVKQVPAKMKISAAEEEEEKNNQPTWMKEVGKLGLLPSALTVEARGMSEVTKTILNPAIRFKDGSPSRGSSSRRRSLLLQSSSKQQQLSHVRTEAAGSFCFVLFCSCSGSVQFQKMSEKGGSCSQSVECLGAASPPRSSLKPGRVSVPSCCPNSRRLHFQRTPG